MEPKEPEKHDCKTCPYAKMSEAQLEAIDNIEPCMGCNGSEYPRTAEEC